MSLRILVTRTDRIGDVVLSSPVFSAIRARYPEAHIAAMVLNSNRDLVEGNPYLDEVILYDKKGAQFTRLDTLRFALSLRKKRFDIVVNLHATNRVHLVSYFARIPKRIGYRKRLGFLLTDAIRDQKWKGERHESDYNFDLLRLIDVPRPDEMKPYLPLEERHKDALKSRLAEEGIQLKKPYVAIHPSASCPSRVWHAERYAQVADELTRKWKTDVVLIAGGGSDRVFTDRVKSFMHAKPVNLAGKLSLGMLAWLLKDARVLISNDSGPVHMAAALDVPVVAIFGRSLPGLSPRRWKPLGRRSLFIHKDVGCIECAAHRCNLGFLCLNEVTVEDVLSTVEKYETCLVS